MIQFLRTFRNFILKLHAASSYVIKNNQNRNEFIEFIIIFVNNSELNSNDENLRLIKKKRFLKLGIFLFFYYPFCFRNDERFEKYSSKIINNPLFC
mgnify:CR=1 FL=1